MAALVAEEAVWPVVAQRQGAVGAGGLVAAVGAEEEGAVPFPGRQDHRLPSPLLHLLKKGQGPPREGMALLPPEVQEEDPRPRHGKGEAGLFQHLHRRHQGKVGKGHPQELARSSARGGMKARLPEGSL